MGNRRKWITRFQSIEYIYGFNLDRRALDYLNAITVVPGAVGAWRKELVLGLGGFGHDTLAEDADLTLAIRRLGNVVRYEQEAIAYTEAPEDTQEPREAAFPLGFWHSAGGVEASRCAVCPQIRQSGIRGAPQHLALSGSALVAFAFRRTRHDWRP